MGALRTAAALIAAVAIATTTASANETSRVLRARATHELFDLDGDRAIQTYREAIAADPQDAAAHRGLAGALLARIGMLRGTMTVDSYLGRVASRDVTLPPPPAAIASEFHASIGKAIAIARQNTVARPRDAQAHYELGAALGIR
ncbi:MAG: hypothetical protein AB7J63_13610, partial [Vicinamibacterales bacterium]